MTQLHHAKNGRVNNGNTPDQTTTRILKTSLVKLKEIAYVTKRKPWAALAVIIDAEHERVVPPKPINVSRR